jgi:hypothetical protein
MFTEIGQSPTRDTGLSAPLPITKASVEVRGSGYPKFRNDRGFPEICIGVSDSNVSASRHRRTTRTATTIWAKWTRSSVPTAGRSSASILD